MKLNELDAQRQTATIARIFESHLGKRLDFENLNGAQTRHMLRRVRSLVKEQRSAPTFYTSEQDPNYLKLVMMEQALVSRLRETGEVAMAIDVNDPKTKQTMDKASKGMTLNPDEQKTMTALALMKKEGAKTGAKRMVKESELQTAQVVLASQDMLDRLQKMMEDISEMQFKDLPALVDSIKNDMGADQATKYQADATAALTSLLAAIQAGKTQLETAQGVITGQAPIVPGDPGAELDGQLGADAGMDMDVDADALSADDGDAADLDIDADIEVGDDVKALGRERR